MMIWTSYCTCVVHWTSRFEDNSASLLEITPLLIVGHFTLGSKGVQVSIEESCAIGSNIKHTPRVGTTRKVYELFIQSRKPAWCVSLYLLTQHSSRLLTHYSCAPINPNSATPAGHWVYSWYWTIQDGRIHFSVTFIKWHECTVYSIYPNPSTRAKQTFTVSPFTPSTEMLSPRSPSKTSVNRFDEAGTYLSVSPR
jgi:hypothetical protein